MGGPWHILAPDVAYDPELYALVHTGSPGDEAFYARVCEGVDSVLELGCGYGRILSAIAAPQRQVVGIEIDAGFRAMAERRLASVPSGRHVTVRAGDMRAFAVDGRFDRILIPHSGLYCLLNEADVVSCLGCVAQHLAPGGELVFDAYLADDFHAEGATDEGPAESERTELTEIELDGQTYAVSESSTWVRDEQRIDARYFHVPHGGGAERVGTIPQRYLLSTQVEGLLERAGLRLLAMAGDFDGRPVDDPEADTLVVIAASR